jgi:GNAT superfamily N-acetyltransferase
MVPMDAETLIRPATRDDAPLILELIRELAEYEKLADEVTATAEDLERTLFGERKYAEVLIAEADGAPAGYALFFHTYSTFLARPSLYVEDIFVRPAARRRGVATAFLTRLARIALERDCGRLELAVLDWNAPAIALYRKFGAEPLGDWTVQRIAGEALHRLATAD